MLAWWLLSQLLLLLPPLLLLLPGVHIASRATRLLQQKEA
jgi:hypothetical protein